LVFPATAAVDLAGAAFLPATLVVGDDRFAVAPPGAGGAFLAVGLVEAAFFELAFFEPAFFELAFFGGAFFEPDFFGADFFGADFFEPDFFGADFFGAAFFAVDFAGGFRAAFVAAGFFAPVFFGAIRFAPLDRLRDVAPRRAAGFLPAVPGISVSLGPRGPDRTPKERWMVAPPIRLLQRDVRGSLGPVTRTRPAPAVGGLHGSAEPRRELVLVDVADPEPLEPGPLTSDEFDVTGPHTELLGEQRGRGGIGALVDRRRGHAELEGASVAAEDGAAPSARLDMHREDDGVVFDRVQVVDVADGDPVSVIGL
jgi:uncharacterized protein YjbI with pentapeptide repeats